MRNNGLDLLRGVAILLVLGVHVPAFPTWARIGWLGVDLFFVLSGFLISNLLFAEYRKHNRINLKSFYLRRALKLYPSFYLLILSSAAFCVISGRVLQPGAVIAELMFVQNYIGGLWGHTWSLAVEEHFYILLPLTLSWMIHAARGREPFRNLPALFAALAIACLGLRVATCALVPFQYAVHFQESHLRFDSLFFGVLLAYYQNFRPEVIVRWTSRYRKLLFFISFFAILPSLILPNSNQFVYTVGFSLAYVSFGGLILLALYGDDGQATSGKKLAVMERALARIGVFSYSIYLWHLPLAMTFAAIHDWLIDKGWPANPYVLFACYVCSSILVGAGLSLLVELPMLRIRDRFIPRLAEPRFTTASVADERRIARAPSIAIEPLSQA